MRTSVRQRIADVARTAPEETALVGFDTELTEQSLCWRELAETTDDLAGSLRALSDGQDKPCVVVEASNTVHSAIDIAGVLAAELPLFPLNPAAPPAERAGVFDFLGRRFGRVHVMDGRHQPREVDLARTAGAAPKPWGDTAPAYLLATGGSSGVPKISMHRDPIAYEPARTPAMAIRNTGWRTGQRQLIVGPLYHAAPFTVFLDALLDRNTTVLQPFFAPSWTIDLVAGHQIDWMQLTPTHMREILRLRPDRARFASVKAVLHTAARCDADTKRGWIDLLGAHRLYELYGATEDIGVTLVRGDEWLARPGTVGRGVLTQIAIMDDNRRRVPPGTVGTVFMRSPGRPERRGYVDNRRPETTVDGFATVGDRGWVDRDGYLFLEPRKHDVINVGGEKVDPNEVETVVLGHPKVLDTVASGVPHDTLGSVVGVHVMLKPASTMSSGELIAHCGRRLATHKVPKQVRFVEEIPRSAAGKVQRWRLAEAGKGGDRDASGR
ncbi:MAG: AMP-binding protein [Kibdelosporangium sp.]